MSTELSGIFTGIIAITSLIIGMAIGETRSYDKTYKVITVIDNPNCTIGHMN